MISPVPSALIGEAPTRQIRRERRHIIADTLVALFWALFAWRFLRAFLTYYHPHDGLLLLLETFTAVAYLTRRGARTSSGDPGDWVIALAGTMAPLFLYPEPSIFPPTLRFGFETVQALATCVSIVGLSGLGRSFGIVPANRGVRTNGLYRFVRHPIYAGYIVSYVAFTLANPSLRNVALTIAEIGFQVIRINNEEGHLSSDPEYRNYSARTRWRLFPFVY